MPLNVALQLDDRREDRVIVSIRLEPHRGAQRVDGVALELRDESGESLGPRLLLPVSGTLASPLVTRAELTVVRPLSGEARVVATAWWGCEQVQATCPCDHGTSLEHHVLGTGQIGLGDPYGDDLEPVDADERARLCAQFPWLAARRTAPGVLTTEVVLGDPKPAPPSVADEICACFGLEGENAEFLKQLLDADDL